VCHIERTGYDLSPPALPVRFPEINPAAFPPGPPVNPKLSPPDHPGQNEVPSADPYPGLEPRPTAATPGDPRAQAEALLERLRSPSTHIETYLRGLSYDVHILHELAAEPSCRALLCEVQHIVCLRVYLLLVDKYVNHSPSPLSPGQG
jgi:hypothetical protein